MLRCRPFAAAGNLRLGDVGVEVGDHARIEGAAEVNEALSAQHRLGCRMAIDSASIGGARFIRRRHAPLRIKRGERSLAPGELITRQLQLGVDMVDELLLHLHIAGGGRADGIHHSQEKRNPLHS